MSRRAAQVSNSTRHHGNRSVDVKRKPEHGPRRWPRLQQPGSRPCSRPHPEPPNQRRKMFPAKPPHPLASPASAKPEAHAASRSCANASANHRAAASAISLCARAVLALVSALGFVASAAAREPAELGILRVPSLSAKGCAAIPYEPVPVYGEPGGLRIGQLVLDHPEYARKSTETCAFRPQVRLQAEGRGDLQQVAVQALGEGETGIAVYRSTQHSGQTWIAGQTGTRSFWAPVNQGRRYLSLETELVHGLADLPETCDSLGRCQLTPTRVRQLARTAGEERSGTCQPHAYDIKAVVSLPDGRKAYVAHLAQDLRVKYESRLPAEVRVPTYDGRDRWTGFYCP